MRVRVTNTEAATADSAYDEIEVNIVHSFVIYKTESILIVYTQEGRTINVNLWVSVQVKINYVELLEILEELFKLEM